MLMPRGSTAPIQEEYIGYHEEYELFDTNRFNIGPMKQLLWHNIEKPHQALNYLTLNEYLNKIQITNLTAKEARILQA